MSTVRDLWVTKSGRRTARYGRGYRWQAVWTDADGKQHVRSVRRRREACGLACYMEEQAQTVREMLAEVDALLAAVASEEVRER